MKTPLKVFSCEDVFYHSPFLLLFQPSYSFRSPFHLINLTFTFLPVHIRVLSSDRDIPSATFVSRICIWKFG